MKPATPRLRVFAGPNGSGKSTVKEVIPDSWLGVYVNADEIEEALRLTGRLDLCKFGVEATPSEWREFISAHPLVRRAALDTAHTGIRGAAICFDDSRINSYHAALVADFLRHKLLGMQVSFTFETVMSSRDKIEFMRKAQEAGYKVYLYFIATEDPEINVDRVRFRAANGGHPVPEDRIRARYERSLALLDEALTHTNRAYLFDNSGKERTWLAEVTDGNRMELNLKSEVGMSGCEARS